MSYVSAEHDRMLATMIIPCVVEAVDLSTAMVRVRAGEWVSAWVRWHSLSAGQARHWRSPSLKEQGILFSPSGIPAQGTFIPGLYGDAGAQPDNRDHVEVWRFPDGGSLVYDWKAQSYTIELPSGTVTVQVGGTSAVLTDDAVSVSTGTASVEAGTASVKAGTVEVEAGQASVTAGQITLSGPVKIEGPLHVSGPITGDSTIMDAGGNSNHHTH